MVLEIVKEADILCLMCLSIRLEQYRSMRRERKPLQTTGIAVSDCLDRNVECWLRNCAVFPQ